MAFRISVGEMREERLLEEERYGFDDGRDAIHALFEELFESGDHIDKRRIYRSMRYLIWFHDMHKQYKEITQMVSSDVRVIDEAEVDRAVDKEIEYVKRSMVEAIDQI